MDVRYSLRHPQPLNQQRDIPTYFAAFWMHFTDIILNLSPSDLGLSPITVV